MPTNFQIKNMFWISDNMGNKQKITFQFNPQSTVTLYNRSEITHT